MVFEVVIVEKPTKKQEEDGATERIILGPVAVVANDPSSAGIAAVQGKSLDCDMSRIEVLVRPFAG